MGGRRVVLVCQEEALVEECSRSLGDSFSVVVASSFEQAELHLLDRSAWALVVDLAMFQHSVGQALYNKFFQRAGLETRGIRLLTIGPEEAEQKAEPDTLTQPVAVCHLRRPITGEELAQVLRQLYSAEPTTNSLPAPACRMLRGRTRTFVTFAPELFPVLEELELVAGHDVTVLLIGETGSGKTYLSQLLHELSPRFRERFLPVACGTLPPDLIESELFGHVKGAFTSAHRDKIGKFGAAGRGTLLLDEIDVLGLDQQAKLLRVIETGAYEPVGSNSTQLAQARLVVASNQELEPLVEMGKFRQDLYYRLNVLKFILPPLRRRKQDLIPLTKQFISKFAQTHPVPLQEVDAEFFRAIQSYDWPGNIREMENAIRRAIILCRKGRLTPEGLPANVLESYHNNRTSAAAPGGPDDANDQTLDHFVSLTERDVIESALRQHKFNRTAAARSLGISRVTLYNKMRKYRMLTPQVQLYRA